MCIRDRLRRNTGSLSIHITYSDQSDDNVEIVIRDFEQDALRGTGYEVVDYKFFKQRSRVEGFYRIIIEMNILHRISRTEKAEKPRYLYHITSSKFADKIEREGIKPRKGPGDFDLKTYTSRVYLLTKKTNWDEENEHGSIAGSAQHGIVVFRVDTKKFNKFNIYSDPEMAFDPPIAVWTPTHIPARALDIVFDGRLVMITKRERVDRLEKNLGKWNDRFPHMPGEIEPYGAGLLLIFRSDPPFIKSDLREMVKGVEREVLANTFSEVDSYFFVPHKNEESSIQIAISFPNS